LNSFSSLAAIIGGIVGYFALEKSQFLIPYILMLSASSFLYIALTDLFPMLQVRHHKYGNIRQVSYLSIGLVLTFTVSIFLHQH
jgi:zinc and cadmium transporter